MFFLKMIFTSWLISIMIKNSKKIILIIALASGYISNIASNPDRFLKETERKVASFNHSLIKKSCDFYSKNKTFLAARIRAPKKACDNFNKRSKK